MVGSVPVWRRLVSVLASLALALALVPAVPLGGTGVAWAAQLAAPANATAAVTDGVGLTPPSITLSWQDTTGEAESFEVTVYKYLGWTWSTTADFTATAKADGTNTVFLTLNDESTDGKIMEWSRIRIAVTAKSTTKDASAQTLFNGPSGTDIDIKHPAEADTCPTDITAASTTDGLMLAWTNRSSATAAYVGVWRRSGTSGSFERVAGTSISATDTTWTDTDVTSDTQYQYRLAYLTIEGKRYGVAASAGDSTGKDSIWNESGTVTYVKPVPKTQTVDSVIIRASKPVFGGSVDDVLKSVTCDTEGLSIKSVSVQVPNPATGSYTTLGPGDTFKAKFTHLTVYLSLDSGYKMGVKSGNTENVLVNGTKASFFTYSVTSNMRIFTMIARDSDFTVPAHDHADHVSTTLTNNNMGTHFRECTLCGAWAWSEKCDYEPGAKVYKAASETAHGEARGVCKVCGHVSGRDDLKTVLHYCKDWTITKEPTLTEAGSRTGTCTVCGKTVTEAIPAGTAAYDKGERVLGLAGGDVVLSGDDAARLNATLAAAAEAGVVSLDGTASAYKVDLDKNGACDLTTAYDDAEKTVTVHVPGTCNLEGAQTVELPDSAKTALASANVEFFSSIAVKLPALPKAGDVVGVAGGIEYTLLDPEAKTVAANGFDAAVLPASATVPASVTLDEVGYQVTAIADSAFENCPSTSFTLASGITAIGDLAFADSAVTAVEIPDTVTVLGDSAFRGSSLMSVEVPGSVAALGEYAFAGCPLLAFVELAPGVKTVGANAFMECASLATVELSEGLTGIGETAFAECPALAELTVPASVTLIGQGAFANCPTLKKVTFAPGSTVADIGALAFGVLATSSVATYVDGVTVRYSEADTGVQFAWNASQAKLKAMLDSLSMTIGGTAPRLVTFELEAALDALKAAVTAAGALAEADYTPESYAALKDAVDKGALLLADESATKEQVVAAQSAIETATAALVKA